MINKMDMMLPEYRDVHDDVFLDRMNRMDLILSHTDDAEVFS